VWALKRQQQREGDRLRDRARETERKKERGRRTENVSEPLSASATDLWLTGSIGAQEEEEVLVMERMTCDPYLCLMNLRHKYLHEVEEAEEVRRSSLLASHHTSTVGVELEKVCLCVVLGCACWRWRVCVCVRLRALACVRVLAFRETTCISSLANFCLNLHRPVYPL
jgi:hypothetical protein